MFRFPYLNEGCLMESSVNVSGISFQRIDYRSRTLQLNSKSLGDTKRVYLGPRLIRVVAFESVYHLW